MLRIPIALLRGCSMRARLIASEAGNL
jgi:hypothetical protein